MPVGFWSEGSACGGLVESLYNANLQYSSFHVPFHYPPIEPQYIPYNPETICTILGVWACIVWRSAFGVWKDYLSDGFLKLGVPFWWSLYNKDHGIWGFIGVAPISGNYQALRKTGLSSAFATAKDFAGGVCGDQGVGCTVMS